MKWRIFILCSVVIAACSPRIAQDATNTDNESLQKIDVVAMHQDRSEAMMYLSERTSIKKNWMIIDSFPVVVGRNGMALDPHGADHLNTADKLKHEGDGCSPAGVFHLGPVFSYEPISGLKMPLVIVDENDLCVDDIHSKYYNRLIDADTILKNDYNSFEHMRRDDAQYEIGVWVLYNANPVYPGNGSCIFLHIWKDEHHGTSGCTAMSKDNMVQLVHWLNADRHPILVQTWK